MHIENTLQVQHFPNSLLECMFLLTIIALIDKNYKKKLVATESIVFNALGGNSILFRKSCQLAVAGKCKYKLSSCVFVTVLYLYGKQFNVDKLVYGDKRKQLDVERGSGLVIAQDYLKM